MDSKELANIIVTEVSVHILLMTLNCNALNSMRKKPKCYVESNDLYLFLSDHSHTSLEKILGQRHEIRYLLGETPPCDSSQGPLSFRQRPTQFLDRLEPEKRGCQEDYLSWDKYLSSCVIVVSLALLNPWKRLEQSCQREIEFCSLFLVFCSLFLLFCSLFLLFTGWIKHLHA